ncbi:MAG: integrase core domain-containing protein [Planctomycetes bacterium]|nr:integrase core domain-containing protein [Planctomycetota bacterium]
MSADILESFVVLAGFTIVALSRVSRNRTVTSSLLNRSYREDILDMYAFMNLQQVRELTSEWLIEYNYDRGHDSLRGKSPIEYARCFPPFTPAVLSEGPKGGTAK